MSEWIDVNYQIPEVDTEVLIACDDDVATSIFRAGHVHGDYWFDIEADKGRIVTHWMPMPEPPNKS